MQLLRLLFFDPEPYSASQFWSPIVVMASNLPHSLLRMEDDLRRLRRLLGWQLPGFDRWMQHGTYPLVNLQPGEFVFFSCYAAAGLVPSVSSFLFTLLEFYGLQLQHMSLHSLILVVIFIHFCEVFVCVRPSVILFRLFHVLRWSRKGSGMIDTYYLHFHAKGPIAYIVPISPSKWNRWREDWVII
jgi:hypothetical protein